MAINHVTTNRPYATHDLGRAIANLPQFALAQVGTLAQRQTNVQLGPIDRSVRDAFSLRPNTSAFFNTDQWDYLKSRQGGVFHNLVQNGIVSSHSVRGLHRIISKDSNNEATYTNTEDSSLKQEVVLARQYDLPINIYGRPIPKIPITTKPSDTRLATQQGTNQARELLAVAMPLLKPGDTLTIDLEGVSTPAVTKGIKYVQEWNRASPAQRMAFVTAYVRELDEALGSKATVYSLPGFMKRALPYPLPGNVAAQYNMTPAQVAQYNRDYEKLAENRPLWIVDAFGAEQRAEIMRREDAVELLGYPALFRYPPDNRQIALQHNLAGNFALGGVNVEFVSGSGRLDQNVDTRSLQERVRQSYRSRDYVIAIGHRNRWEVSQIQYALRKEGLWSGPIDGVYSENLAQSVSAAQKKHRLPETGTADYATLMALPEDKVPRAPARGDEISPSNRVDH